MGLNTDLNTGRSAPSFVAGAAASEREQLREFLSFRLGAEEYGIRSEERRVGKECRL